MSSKYYFNEICMTYQAAAKVDLRHLLVDFHAHIVDVVGFVCWCECSGCAREVFSIFLASLWPFPSGVVAAHQYI